MIEHEFVVFINVRCQQEAILNTDEETSKRNFETF